MARHISLRRFIEANVWPTPDATSIEKKQNSHDVGFIARRST